MYSVNRSGEIVWQRWMVCLLKSEGVEIMNSKNKSLLVTGPTQVGMFKTIPSALVPLLMGFCRLGVCVNGKTQTNK